MIFLILLENRDCEYSVELPCRGDSNEYPNLCFEQKFEKYQSFLSENFQFLEVKCCIYSRTSIIQTPIIQNSQ